MAVSLQPVALVPTNAPIRVGVACPIPGERAAFIEWLGHAGYEPVPMLNVDALVRDLATRPIEALIADVQLVSILDLPRIVRILGANRPLVLVGNPDQAIEAVPKDAAWVDRPMTRDSFLLSVALALAEGRPARRSPRRMVPKLMSSVDGVNAKIVDISAEGVRLEISGGTPSALPPYFTLRVPGFGVAAKVKRVWVAMPSQGSMWCGGIIDRPVAERNAVSWHKFLENAPTIGTQIMHLSTA